MNVLYSSQKGGKPLMIGMNHAKRMARRMDKRDRLAELRLSATTGTSYPYKLRHHQRLVEQRHAAIHDRGDAYAERQRILQTAPVTGVTIGGDQEAGGHVGAIPQPAPGTDDHERDDWEGLVRP